MRRPAVWAAPVVVLLALAARGEDPPPLPIGATAGAVARKDAPAVFRFDAPSAGLITAAVQVEGAAPADLVLFVCDDEGQPLPDVLDPSGQPFPGGRSDRDLLGSRGTEALTLLAPEAGRYVVIVEVVGAPEAAFTITGAFAPMPGLARRASDPDERPSGATEIAVTGQVQQREDSLTPKEGDLRDWFLLRCQRAGTLRVVVRARDGDLRLDAHAPANLRTAVATSDDDEQGVAGNESVAIPVQADQVVLVRVAAVFASADKIPYRLVVAITD